MNTKNILFTLLAIVLAVAALVVVFVAMPPRAEAPPELETPGEGGEVSVREGEVAIGTDKDLSQIDAGEIEKDLAAQAMRGWREYDNPALGFSFRVPPEWVIDENSKPGVYTVRAKRELSSGNELRFDVRLYDAEIDVGLEEVFRTTIRGRTAYRREFDGCARASQTACVMESVKLPIGEGERRIEEGGTIWEVRVAELNFGAFREFENEALADRGVNVHSSKAINDHFGLREDFEDGKDTLELIFDTFELKNL